MKALSDQDKDEPLAPTRRMRAIRLAGHVVTTLAGWEMQAKATPESDDYRFTAND